MAKDEKHPLDRNGSFELTDKSEVQTYNERDPRTYRDVAEDKKDGETDG